MEWISKCVSSFYSNDCPSDCKKSCLPPIVSEPLPDIEPTTDCLACDKPCGLHPVVPANLNIDQSRPLYNTVPAYAIHIIILTGKADWPAHIEDDGVAKALIEAINIRKKKVSMFERSENDRFHPRSLRAHVPDRNSLSQRIIVTNASLPSQYTKQRNACDVLLMPDNVIISNITPRRASAFIDFVCGKPSDQFTVRPSPFTNLLLVCGHARKDKRCGTLGPMLQTALTVAMDNAGVAGQVALVSHLGGHAFAGNVVLYTHNGQRAIWYGRVTPCHCEEIVQLSILQDRVIQELVRGVFDAGCVSAQHMKNKAALLDW